MPRRSVLYCEMCGQPIFGEAYTIEVEGIELTVCGRCYEKHMSRSRTRHEEYLPLKLRATQVSKPSPAPRPVSRPSTSSPRVVDRLAERYEVVPDYAERVRKARERLGLTQEQLAIMVREKVNVIKRIEAGTLVPTIDLARRLEKVLGIKLLEPVVEEETETTFVSRRRSRKEFELTLGDIVEIREE